MRIFYDNKATYGQITSILSSSAASGYPAANAVHPFKQLQWKTGTSAAAEWIEFQFPAAVTVQSAIIINHDYTVSDTVTLQANTSSSWGAPPVSSAFTVESVMKQTLGSPASYRYWRIACTKASAGLTRSIGTILLTSTYDTPFQPKYDGYTEKLVDASRIHKSISGQTYAENLPKFYEWKVEFDMIDQTFKDTLDTIQNAVGETGQLAFQVETSGVLTAVRYARLKSLAAFQVNAFDSSLIYDATLEFEEML